MSCPREGGGGKRRNGLTKPKNEALHHRRRKSLTLERIEKRLKKCLTKSGRHDIINKLFREEQRQLAWRAEDLEN